MIRSNYRVRVRETTSHLRSVVLQVQRSKKRLTLGLKPSYFEGDPDTSDDDNDDSDDSDGGSDGNVVEEHGVGKVKVVTPMDVTDASDEDHDQQEQDGATDNDSDDEDSDGNDDDDDDAGNTRKPKHPQGILEGALGKTCALGDASAFTLNFGGLGFGGGGALSDSDEDSDEDSDDGGNAKGYVRFQGLAMFSVLGQYHMYGADTPNNEILD